MISTRLQLEGQNKVRLCFICSGIPFYYLFVGRSAVTEWVASREAPVARNVKDPIWMEMHELPAMLDSEESRVDCVVIYEGRGPSCRDAIWTSGTTRVAWIGVTGRGKARVPSGSKWRVYRRSVKHAALGGVTDATFSCFLASKFVEDHSWELECEQRCVR